MTTKVTDKDLKGISGLIKIHLSEEDIPKFTGQLNTVLEAVEVLKEIDTKNVTETAQTHGLENVTAEDIPQEGLNMDEYNNNSNFENNYFIVKKVL